MRRIDTWEALAVLVAEVGPVVPVSVAARWRRVSPQSVRERIRRGTVPAYLVDGAVYVALVNLATTPFSPSCYSAASPRSGSEPKLT